MSNSWKLTIAALAAVAIAAFATGCGGGPAHKPQSQGAPYEIVVVADHPTWDGPAGDTLRSFLQAKVPMINREEPRFRVLRTLPEGFRHLLVKHPNILMISVDKKYTAPALEMHNDQWAAPQIVLTATAPDMASMTSLLASKGGDILLALEYAEQLRDVALVEGHTPIAITTLLREKFGIEMKVGPGFTVRSEGDNFAWLSYELPTASQGVVIYEYPFSGMSDFKSESLVRRRNEFTARIPGENPGSHMATNPEFTELLFKKINGRQWAEMHGFWRVEGDFMGGPYVNFSTLDAARQRVLAVDFYVYAPDPRASQRNYKRQLEHYIYTLKFLPAQQQQQ